MQSTHGQTSAARRRWLPARAKVDAPIRVLWAETADVFAHHAPIILWLSFLAFALPMIAAAVVGIAYALYFAQTTVTGFPSNVIGVVSNGSLPGCYIYPTDRPTNFSMFACISQWQLLVQMVLGVMFVPMARGVYAWVALNHRNPLAATDAANSLRQTVRRLPVLGFTIFGYGALIGAGALGMLLLFRELRIDTSNAGGSFVAREGPVVARTIGIRTLPYLIPNPGPPYSEGLDLYRVYLRFSSAPVTSTSAGIPVQQPQPAPDDSFWLIGAAAALLMLFGESFFRMRINAIMAAPKPHLFTGFVESMRLGAQFFGRLTWHITLLRMTQFLLTVLFIVTPITLAQALIMPEILKLSWVTTQYRTLIPIALNALTTPVSMVFIAFVAIYDARLYLRLRQSQA